jgi:cytochrome c oxidase subunit 2
MCPEMPVALIRRSWPEAPPFKEAVVVETAPVDDPDRIVSGIWLFTPNEIRVPAGATVTFIASSRDVIHGFSLHDVNVNLMLLPGRVVRATATFERPGEHVFLCHEYCGIAHHTMFGKVIVEDRR